MQLLARIELDRLAVLPNLSGHSQGVTKLLTARQEARNREVDAWIHDSVHEVIAKTEETLAAMFCGWALFTQKTRRRLGQGGIVLASCWLRKTTQRLRARGPEACSDMPCSITGWQLHSHPRKAKAQPLSSALSRGAEQYVRTQVRCMQGQLKN